MKINKKSQTILNIFKTFRHVNIEQKRQVGISTNIINHILLNYEKDDNIVIFCKDKNYINKYLKELKDFNIKYFDRQCLNNLKQFKKQKFDLTVSEYFFYDMKLNDSPKILKFYNIIYNKSKCMIFTNGSFKKELLCYLAKKSNNFITLSINENLY